MMPSLARAVLRHEWKRFLAAILAVTFSGLLLLIQASLLIGLFSTVSAMIDQSDGELWAGFRHVPSVDLGRNLPRTAEAFLRMHPDVQKVEPMHFGNGEWRKPDGGHLQAYLIGVPLEPHALAFAKCLDAEMRRRLQEPGTVIIDEADTGKLGIRVGENVELNRQRVKVVGTLRGLRSVGGINLLTSLATSRNLSDPRGREEDLAAFYLLRLRPGASIEAVRADLECRGVQKGFSVWTAEDLSRRSQMYWLFETGAGLGALFSALLGMVVGMAVTSQILLSAVLASLKEYATLRALGVSMGSLRKVVLEQAFWVGVAGLGITFCLAGGLSPLAARFHVAMPLRAWSFLVTGAVVLLVAMISGLVAVRSLRRAEPATLLR